MISFALLLVIFAEINWFDTSWGCYLLNLATLLFTTFEISKHPTIPQYHISKILEPPNWNSRRLNHTNIRCNLSKNNGFFTPWLVHFHKKKELWLYFSQLFQSIIHLNVKINKLDWLKQFYTASTFFFLYFNTFDR